MTKKCCRCKIEKSVTDFGKMSSAKDGLQSRCKPCNRAVALDYSRKFKERSYTNTKERKKRITTAISEVKRRAGCALCTESDPVCLVFHHLDPTQKELQVNGATNPSVQRIILEAVKCEVVCCNCHRKVHFGNTVIDSRRDIDLSPIEMLVPRKGRTKRMVPPDGNAPSSAS